MYMEDVEYKDELDVVLEKLEEAKTILLRIYRKTPGDKSKALEKTVVLLRGTIDTLT